MNKDIPRSRWPLGLRRGSAAVRLLGLWVQGAGQFVSCYCCVLSDGGFRVGRSLVQRSPTESSVS